jgi:hypothetical protein
MKGALANASAPTRRHAIEELLLAAKVGFPSASAFRVPGLLQKTGRRQQE